MLAINEAQAISPLVSCTHRVKFSDELGGLDGPIGWPCCWDGFKPTCGCLLVQEGLVSSRGNPGRAVIGVAVSGHRAVGRVSPTLADALMPVKDSLPIETQSGPVGQGQHCSLARDEGKKSSLSGIGGEFGRKRTCFHLSGHVIRRVLVPSLFRTQPPDESRLMRTVMRSYRLGKVIEQQQGAR